MQHLKEFFPRIRKFMSRYVKFFHDEIQVKPPPPDVPDAAPQVQQPVEISDVVDIEDAVVSPALGMKGGGRGRC
jgi:hypothetical protein